MDKSLKLAVIGFVVSFIFVIPVFGLKPLLAALLVLVYLGLSLSDFVWQSPELNDNIANKILMLYKVIEIIIALSCVFVFVCSTNFSRVIGLFLAIVYCIIQLRLLKDAMELRRIKVLEIILDKIISNLNFCHRTYNRILKLKEFVDIQLLIDFVQEFKAEQIETLLLTQKLSIIGKCIKTKQFATLRDMM